MPKDDAFWLLLAEDEACALEAGLRLVQSALDDSGLPPAIGRAFTGQGTHQGLRADQIEGLIQRIINAKTNPGEPT